MENTLELNVRAKPITTFIKPASGEEAKQAMDNGIVVVMNAYQDPALPEFDFRTLNPFDHGNAAWLEKNKKWVRIDPSRKYVFTRMALMKSVMAANGKKIWPVVSESLNELKSFENHDRFIKWEEKTIRHYIVEKDTFVY